MTGKVSDPGPGPLDLWGESASRAGTESERPPTLADESSESDAPQTRVAEIARFERTPEAAVAGERVPEQADADVQIVIPAEAGIHPGEPARPARPEWPPLVGGEGPLRQLEAALAAPVHAYLLTGTPGGDKRAIARAFAAELLAAAAAGEGADVAERHRRRALAGVHPDAVLVEPEGRALLAAEATSIITEAARRPLEGDRKVIVCDRFHTASPAVAASLLKTIEEPPAATTIVLLADDVPPSHVTVASRCVTVRFPAPSADEMREWLIDSGVPPEPARQAARAVAGDPARAGDLIAGGNLAGRLETWWSVPERLDGTGARAAATVDELRALVDSVAAGGAQTADPADRAEGQKRDRRHRRARDAELRFGFAVLAERYRQDLTDAGGAAPAVAVQAADAIDRLRGATAALVRNPDEKLLLQNLLLHLPKLGE